MSGITDWNITQKRHEVEESIRRELELYQNRMSEFLSENVIPPSSLELRAKHAEFKMEAVDSFRKNSTGRPIGVWKLERELELIFEETLLMTKRVRRESFTDGVKFARVSLVI
jgi:hypothetical protein